MKTITKILSLATLSCLGGLTSTTALAGPLVFDGFDTCTTLNCNAVVLNGISQRNAFGDSVPFILEVFADVNQCLRLDVTSQASGTDMEIALLSPSGAYWKDDDTNGSRPLITARADVRGYYTVQINQFNGAQPVNSLQLFTLAYGLYAPGNPGNCPAPTARFELAG